MYVCCCCCRNQDLNKRVRPKKNKYHLGAADNGSHKLLDTAGDFARAPSRQRYSTGNPSTSPKWREDDDFGSVDTLEEAGRDMVRPSSTRSARSTRSTRSVRSVRRSTSRRAVEQPAPTVIDLHGELEAAATVSSSIMARNVDGSRSASRPGTSTRGRSSRPGTSRRPASSDSGSSDSSSSGSDTSSGSDSEDGVSRAPSRARTPGRTISRQAMSNAPLTSRSRAAKPASALVPDMDLSTLSSEDAGDSRSGSFGNTQGARRDSLSNLNL